MPLNTDGQDIGLITKQDHRVSNWLLGATIAWAVTQPAWLGLTTMTVMGLGMAAPYIIATGGAGSFGSPAFFKGTWISRNAIAAMTATPARYEGLAKTWSSLPNL